MITLIRNNDTKIIDEKSSLVPSLLEQGWAEKEVKNVASTKKKEVKDGVFSTTGN